MDLWHTLSFVMVRTNHIALVHHVVAILVRPSNQPKFSQKRETGFNIQWKQ